MLCTYLLDSLIAPVNDILMFNIKYPTMHKVQMHVGAIKILHGLCVCTEDNSLASGLSSVQMHKPLIPAN